MRRPARDAARIEMSRPFNVGWGHCKDALKVGPITVADVREVPGPCILDGDRLVPGYGGDAGRTFGSSRVQWHHRHEAKRARFVRHRRVAVRVWPR